eukprot:TRINITY_DN2529_c0_g1_i1.p1 TRINITY_DN2529_c0_g1~~TRINITY_DN2529_c0_g1_i1.p1  ORF type:complete len:518 (+),score=219.39 TRINITY_DN2529_c0_g1_i1:77-1630(+)
MATYAEGEVIRLQKLKLMQMMYEGSLAAVRQCRDASKGAWTVVLPSGDTVDVFEVSMKKLDQEDMFMQGDLVRMHGLPMLMLPHEQTTAIVQHYVPQKDAWSVQLRNGQLSEVFSGSMKPVDAEDLFHVGQLIRVVSGDGAGQVVTVKGYLPPKDAWAAFLPSGQQIEVFSENCTTTADAPAFAEGDLVVVDGMNVVVQTYNAAKDNYTVISPDGHSFEAFKEEMEVFESPKHGASAQKAPPAGGGGGFNFKNFMGLMGGGAASTSPAKDDAQPKKTLMGGVKSMLGRNKDAAEHTFGAGEQAHISGVLGTSDGTVALIKEGKNEKGKYKVILPSGKTVAVSAASLKPPVSPAEWPEGTLVTLRGDRKGGVAVVQSVLEDKGQLALRLPNGKAKHVFPDQVLRDGEVSPSAGSPTPPAALLPSPAPLAPAPKKYDTANPLYPELVQKLAEAGTTFEEVTQFSDPEIDELLKDELKIPLLKRVRMKNIIKGVIAVATPVEQHIDPTPKPADDAFAFLK